MARIRLGHAGPLSLAKRGGRRAAALHAPEHTGRGGVQDAAKAGGRQFVNTHAPNLKRLKGTLTDSLGEEFTRGGSALGGASIYFERDYN